MLGLPTRATGPRTSLKGQRERIRSRGGGSIRGGRPSTTDDRIRQEGSPHRTSLTIAEGRCLLGTSSRFPRRLIAERRIQSRM